VEKLGITIAAHWLTTSMKTARAAFSAEGVYSHAKTKQGQLLHSREEMVEEEDQQEEEAQRAVEDTQTKEEGPQEGVMATTEEAIAPPAPLFTAEHQLLQT